MLERERAEVDVELGDERALGQRLRVPLEPVGAARGVAERSPEVRLDGAQRDVVAVAGAVGSVAGPAAVQQLAFGPRHVAARAELGQREELERHHHVGEREVDLAALAVALARQQRAEDRGDREHRGRAVGDRREDVRAPIGRPVELRMPLTAR